MADINDIQRRWEQDFADADAARRLLQERLAPLRARAEKFNAEKPKNIWGKLSHAFNKATGMALLGRKIRRLEGGISDRDVEISDAALAAYRGLGELALKDMTNGDSFRRDYQTLGYSLSLLAVTQEEVRNAIRQCDDASNMETMDAFTNNKGISLLSYMETSEASGAIKSAKLSLDKLQRELQSTPLLHQDLGEGLRFDNNIGLALDMIGGMGGMFMSLSNKRDLDRAASQLRSVFDDLGKVGSELDKSREQILNLAISVGRKWDGGINNLAETLAPHLPRDIAQGMAPKNIKGFTL